jgi:AcrR family transcriptional regulator
MPTPPASSEKTRRTQPERRAATRTALLDAAIDCLAEEGYANTTTRRIAERAGVTPGALQHHFATKAELLGHARRHLGSKFAQEILGHASADIPSIQLRAERLLDRMWDLLKGPLFAAMAELWVAARTDAELRKELTQAERDGARLAVSASRILNPELVDRPGFSQLLATGRATIRGLAMARFINDAGAEAAWPATRAHLLGLLVQFAADARVTP